ncbi:hypothetical protein KSS94_10445 [Pseudomonas fakonensis]|uniref:Uncharacterized protein n=1 Tax=Pseudomonas fakonensis TaxID=2842355 RepID=A0ABX8NAU7_9PSED|nr:hypothetical protein [Pseudomonas fakonensis]QXH53498.1 hypothetical protein KSS94_10445 [Pseudomonas fakonensis]
MPREGSESDGTPGIGPGYAVWQLSKALSALDDNLSQQARAHAAERITRWQQVIAHALQGTAHYGSPTPFADVPAWVTLEVVTGGFATGRLLAGGALTEHERELAASIPGVRPGFERLDINAWHLTDEGVAALQRRLASGDYRVDVPEEAALATVAWLLGQQRVEQARRLIETIVPYFDCLRFFPAPAQGLPVSAAQVHVVGAGEVRQQLAKRPAQPRLAVQKQVIETRLPLYDAAIALCLSTYQEGWPCRCYPQGWHEQAAKLCAQFDAACRAHSSAKGRAMELFTLLAQCSEAPGTLTGRQVGRIRRIVDDFVRKHGLPDSHAHRQYRARQRGQVATPGHHLIARAVSERLARYPADAGICDFAALCEPITTEEAQAFKLAQGVVLPQAIRRRLERCRSGTLTELIDCGVITSGDTVAQVLPAMAAELCSAGLGDAQLRRLYAATYAAFRRRRSLLLLHLHKQVALSDLPWVEAVEGDRQPEAVAADAARQALVEASALTLSAFPQAILPNKLLQELRALCKAAALDLPWVDEVAADIFMGEFSNRFIRAARQAAQSMAGTLYARYYDIDTDALATLADRPKAALAWWQRSQRACNSLAVLSAERAQAELGGYHPATNGTIIEQQQILTTQNLALLFCELGLKTLLQPRLGTLALTCFKWVCARQQIRLEHRHARLVMLKNTAYAWRQMVFYLAMLDEPERQRAFEAIETHFAAQPAAWRDQFLPAMLGLRLAAAGHRLPQGEPSAEGARVFLGWSTQPHWLLPS